MITQDNDRFKIRDVAEGFDAETTKLQNSIEKWQASNLFLGALLFVLFGLFFLIFGIFIFLQSGKVKLMSLEYDNLVQCSPDKIKCALNFTLSEDIAYPIYVYYQLNPFYQNNKVYLDSYSESQMLGNAEFNQDECSPVITNAQMGVKKSVYRDEDGKQLDLEPNDVAIPCGLIAQTLFNDTYRLHQIHTNGTSEYIPIYINQIAQFYDQRNYKDIDLKKQWISMTDEHLQVWMRPSPTSTFKKLWGRIDQVLQKGAYQVEIQNNYNVIQFQASKTFILQHLSSFGGLQTDLVIGFISSGIFLLNMSFFMIYLEKKDRQRRQNQKMD